MVLRLLFTFQIELGHRNLTSRRINHVENPGSPSTESQVYFWGHKDNKVVFDKKNIISSPECSHGLHANTLLHGFFVGRTTATHQRLEPIFTTKFEFIFFPLFCLLFFLIFRETASRTKQYESVCHLWAAFDDEKEK